jgi:hypothetical protein
LSQDSSSSPKSPKIKQPTKGDWQSKKAPLGSLPPLHVVSGELFLCSVHETHVQGEDKTNSNLFAASKDMYEAITIGLTGADLQGNPVEQTDAIHKLKASKAKAEGKKYEPEAKGD